ncbi:MAG: acetoacetate decarboxylase family protein [Synechococcaceae cyanobacterium SM2_3_1]|nr:acetoacetate decarboxylase family protein [Synechococcaceae cyanobacterium SM2_3_1]
MTNSTYPPAPWHLQGSALINLHLVKTTTSRRWIPPELDLVSLWPGRTLAGVYLSSYEAGSVLLYHELIVAAGMVRYRGQVGFWISHIYVDNPNALAGGHEIWQLPKEMATFNWEVDQIQVFQEDQLLYQLAYHQPAFKTGSLPFSGQVISGMREELLAFTGRFQGSWGLISAQVQISDSAPFADLKLESPFLSFQGSPLSFEAGIPYGVGARILQSTGQEAPAR